MFKKYMKNLAIFLVGCTLLFASLPSVGFADEDGEQEDGDYDSKDEAVYGKLDPTGKTDSMYVVNTFHDIEPGKLIDYGQYKDVRNLTDLTDIDIVSDNKVSLLLGAGENEFYYQGQLENKPLPWDISINYLLDGEKIQPDELAGKSGEVEIQIQTRKNEEVNPVFFNYYLQQISVTMDPDKFNDIQAPKGTKATEGKNQQITFTILPKEEDDLIITADVTNFELDPIEMNALPADIAIDDPDFSSMTNQFKDLSDAISELHDGTEQLNAGISDLNEGASELSSGSSEYRSGINSLNQRSDELVNGSAQIKNALNQVNDQVNSELDIPDLSGLEELPDGIRQFADGLRKASQGIKNLKENFDEAFGALDEAIGQIPDLELTEEDIKALKESDLDEQTVEQLIQLSKTARNAKATFEEVRESFDRVPGRLGDVIERVNETADEAEATADEMEKGLDSFDPEGQIRQLQEGISEMNSEYNEFHEGLVSYTDGVGSLAASFNELDEGIQSLSGNIPSLDEGASELEEGAGELEKETEDLPGEVESEIDEALDEFDYSDFEPVSFVSEKNDDIEVVQFVLQTDSIEMPEEDTDETDEEEEKDGFWQRLLGLFGL